MNWATENLSFGAKGTNTSGPTAVNVFGKANPSKLTLHIGQATMLANLSQLSKPKFSGKAHEWQQFGKEWEQFLRLQESLGSTPDETKLAMLKTCVDETTQKR